MKIATLLASAAIAVSLAGAASAQQGGTAAPATPPAATWPKAEYVSIPMEIAVNKPAAEVWAKVGGYCDISAWLNNVDCKITSGDGGVGTVRVLAGGRVTEILVAQTGLAYGYTQPDREGQFYKLYHGFKAAKPVTAKPVRRAASKPVLKAVRKVAPKAAA